MHLWKWEGIQKVDMGVLAFYGEKEVTRGTIKQQGMLGESSSLWMSMVHEEGRSQILEGLVWHGLGKLNINFISIFLLFLFCFFRYKAGKIFSIMFTHKESVHLPPDWEKEDSNKD